MSSFQFFFQKEALGQNIIFLVVSSARSTIVNPDLLVINHPLFQIRTALINNISYRGILAAAMHSITQHIFWLPMGHPTYHDISWHIMTYHDMPWHAMMWRDVTWHNITQMTQVALNQDSPSLANLLLIPSHCNNFTFFHPFRKIFHAPPFGCGMFQKDLPKNALKTNYGLQCGDKMNPFPGSVNVCWADPPIPNPCLMLCLLAPKVLLDYLQPMMTIQSHPILPTYSSEWIKQA